MALNWVMLSPLGEFTPLPNERTLWKSSNRTSFLLQSKNKYPGREPFSLLSSNGCVHLTNRRVIYLPDPKTKDFESFAAPILNLHDTHVTVPWLGPNACVALVQPVLNGGIPPHHVALELKMTFKDSGAPEFHSKLCVIKERMNEAVANTTPQDETAGGRGSDGVNGVNYESVHLDQLPAYEEALSAPAPQPVQSVAREQNPPPPSEPSSQEPPSESQSQAVPAEPPPGYEEAQRDTVAESLERQLRLHEDRS